MEKARSFTAVWVLPATKTLLLFTAIAFARSPKACSSLSKWFFYSRFPGAAIEKNLKPISIFKGSYGEGCVTIFGPGYTCRKNLIIIHSYSVYPVLVFLFFVVVVLP